MYYRIIKNDILKNKAITLTITFFIAAAAMLVALVAILLVNLTGAVDTLMVQSETTHFMQMHSGEIDTEQLDDFATGNTNVDEFQVLEFLNIDGAQMLFPKALLGKSMQDNGLSVQSKSFDYLLDLDGNVISVKDGELYVPVCYMRDNTAKVGDKAVICGKEFTVAGFLRDSQMNSALSSSKRFLVSEKDFMQMQSRGKVEYLIEFRLKDLSAMGTFETDYASAGLPANGPTVTYGLFKTMNGFSDGMMMSVLLLVSLLVVAVAFMCIRFTLLAKIEDDYCEIGVMKAIGLHITDIRKKYIAKYAAISFFGCVFGYVLSLAFQGTLTQNIRIYMGESKNSFLAPVFGVFGILLVFLIIIAYVGGVLHRLRKISAAEAIRFGARQEKSLGGKRFSLGQSKLFSTNVFLGIKDVLVRKNLYATMLCVVVIASFIMIVPQNLHNTISAKSFSSYMGIGNYDLRIDIQQTEHISEKSDKTLAALKGDSAIANIAILNTKIFKTNTEENLKVEIGDHSVFPVAYSAGKAPSTEDEIALSAMNADELSKQVGDSITLYIDGSEKILTVCGIYSDITNGGKTAKAVFNDDSVDAMWSILCVSLVNPELAAAKAVEYKERFPIAKVSSINEYITQIFGQTVSSVKTASYAAIATALVITVLVTLLFMKMLIAKDRYSIAVIKAVGYTSRDIKGQYAVRAIFVLLIGVLLGTLLANTLGEVLGGMVISAFGASSFKFTINPVSAYVLCPLLMIFTVLIGAALGTNSTGKIKISENIKEG